MNPSLERRDVRAKPSTVETAKAAIARLQVRAREVVAGVMGEKQKASAEDCVQKRQALLNDLLGKHITLQTLFRMEDILAPLKSGDHSLEGTVAVLTEGQALIRSGQTPDWEALTEAWVKKQASH